MVMGGDPNKTTAKNIFYGYFGFLKVLDSTLLHLPPFRFHCVSMDAAMRSNPELLRFWLWQLDALITRIDLFQKKSRPLMYITILRELGVLSPAIPWTERIDQRADR
jgi:hypothetical protein